MVGHACVTTLAIKISSQSMHLYARVAALGFQFEFKLAAQGLELTLIVPTIGYEKEQASRKQGARLVADTS